ncbi:hypothetical protein PAPYR_10049 [Paratrimastix pyriformis]|uniref:Uncharacterized protein n=1 Tax=Paratrimastix pyriformis TaxID=342808 RepID=A0ABQ8UAL7_9EUKA|nr:hypothetical protein PAPYR_10049 [Paratrimastix pyriformis]
MEFRRRRGAFRGSCRPEPPVTVKEELDTDTVPRVPTFPFEEKSSGSNQVRARTFTQNIHITSPTDVIWLEELASLPAQLQRNDLVRVSPRLETIMRTSHFLHRSCYDTLVSAFRQPDLPEEMSDDEEDEDWQELEQEEMAAIQEAEEIAEEEGAQKVMPAVRTVNRSRSLVLTGSPGVGKSTWLLYLIGLLTQPECAARAELWADLLPPDTFPLLVYWRPETIAFWTPVTGWRLAGKFALLTHLHTVWPAVVLLDSVQIDQSIAEALSALPHRVALATSPNESRYTKLIGHLPDTMIRYMPALDRAESDRFVDAIAPTTQLAARARFARDNVVGGVPRDLLSIMLRGNTPENLITRLKTAAGRLSTADVVDNDTESGGGPQLFYLCPRNERLSAFRYELPTPRIKAIVKARLANERMMPLDTLFKFLHERPSPELITLRALASEVLTHRLVASGALNGCSTRVTLTASRW